MRTVIRSITFSGTITHETKLLPFVIQHNVLSDVHFCNVRLHVVGLLCTEQSKLRPLAFIVI